MSWAREYYQKNKDHINAMRRERRRLNPELQRKWGQDAYARMKADPEKQKAYRLRQRTQHENARTAAINALGGRCANCGQDDLRTLELDHVFGRGDQPKKEFIRRKMMRDLAAGTYDGLPIQILCGNCHNIKTYEERLNT